MAQLMIFLAAQQNAGEDIIDFPAVGIRQTNHHFGEEIRVEIVIHMLFPVCRRVEQFGAAALLNTRLVTAIAFSICKSRFFPSFPTLP